MRPTDWMVQAAEQGLSVMPLHPGRKEPALTTWKDFTWDPATIEVVKKWAHTYPDCNYGILCGLASGVVVIDTDNAEASYQVEGWAKWTFVVGTGKGTHYYCRHPLNGEVGNRIGALPGIDLKADGGYVVGPGSMHTSGREYTMLSLYGWEGLLHSPRYDEKWLPNVKKVDKSDAMAPVMADRCMTDKEMQAKLLDVTQATRDLLMGVYQDGPRWNQRIFNAACDMVGVGWPFGDALRLILMGAGPNTEEDAYRAEATVRSAYSRPRIGMKDYVARLKDRGAA